MTIIHNYGGIGGYLQGKVVRFDRGIGDWISQFWEEVGWILHLPFKVLRKDSVLR
jgi:hypothetical protein